MLLSGSLFKYSYPDISDTLFVKNKYIPLPITLVGILLILSSTYVLIAFDVGINVSLETLNYVSVVNEIDEFFI